MRVQSHHKSYNPSGPTDLTPDNDAGGDRDAWAVGDFAERFDGSEMSYRSKWYVHHGQFLFVAPKQDLVIAWLSSEHAPTDPVWSAYVFQAVEKICAACA